LPSIKASYQQIFTRQDSYHPKHRIAFSHNEHPWQEEPQTLSRVPSILIDGKFVVNTKADSVQDDISTISKDLDFSKFKRSNSMAKDGPALKKHKAIMYAVRQSMKSVYKMDNPQQKMFMQRAIKRRQDSLNVKPNKFVDSDLLKSFELHKQGQFEKAKEEL
jgi:hypothetical protein